MNLDNAQREACLDSFWLEVMLCLIGEAFEKYTDLVNGAVVNVRRKGDKVSLWLGEASDEAAIKTVGLKLKERLGIGEKTPIGFEMHQDVMSRSGSTMKSKFVV